MTYQCDNCCRSGLHADEVTIHNDYTRCVFCSDGGRP